MRKMLLAVAALSLVGCSPISDTSVTEDRPTPVHMKYLGEATTGTQDPINGCRVYVFSVAGYYQTAILCANGKATTASAGHQKSSDDSAQSSN